jgi:hypothetical protein
MASLGRRPVKNSSEEMCGWLESEMEVAVGKHTRGREVCLTSPGGLRIGETGNRLYRQNGLRGN